MFTKIKKPIGITQLRKRLSKYFEEAKEGPVLVSLDRGGDTRVILDTDAYNQLVEDHEDLCDSKELTRLLSDDTGEYVSLDEVKEKYAA